MKKTLIIAFSILSVALLIYITFGRGEMSAPETVTESNSPFGSGENVSVPALGSETVGETIPLDENIAESPLFRISNVPVAGFTLIARGTDTWVRFVDRGTGHIYDALLSRAGSGGTFEKIKITNNTIPKVYEALFKGDGNAVLLRTLENESETIKNTALSLTAPRGTSTSELYGVTATNLRGNIASAIAGGGDALFYLLKEAPSINSSTFTGNNQRLLLSTPLSDWSLERLGNNLLLYPKASAFTPGVAYSLPATGGNLTKLVGPLNGLAALANSAGNRLLFSYIENGESKLSARNLQNNTTDTIEPVSLSEKCVWSNKSVNVFYCGTPLNGVTGSEPDNWYLGITHFTDYIWRFDTASDISELISEPKTDFGVDLDIYEPKISINDEFMVFINKRDLTLWALRLNQP